MSCTATTRFILTMPVSISTETSAICTPPTPDEFKPPGLRWLFSPISEILVTPSFWQAAFQVRLFAGLPFAWMRPSTACNCSAGTPIEGATASSSLANAFTLDLRVDDETPPTVVDPPEGPQGG